MSNKKEEKKINNKKIGTGSPIHVYTSIEAFLWLFIPAAIVAIFTSMGSSNFFASFLIETFAGTLLLYFFKAMFRVIGIIPDKIPDASFSCNCPYCDTNIWVKVPNIRNKCPNCKNEIGLSDGMVYKINKNNSKYFKTESEKTNDLLEIQVSKNSKTNLDELKKLKELLDSGAITQEEFDKKKKELLK